MEKLFNAPSKEKIAEMVAKAKAKSKDIVQKKQQDFKKIEQKKKIVKKMQEEVDQEKVCPFMSSIEIQLCNKNCMLYNQDAKYARFRCALSSIPMISLMMSKKAGYQKPKGPITY